MCYCTYAVYSRREGREAAETDPVHQPAAHVAAVAAAEHGAEGPTLPDPGPRLRTGVARDRLPRWPRLPQDPTTPYAGSPLPVFHQCQRREYTPVRRWREVPVEIRFVFVGPFDRVRDLL